MNEDTDGDRAALKREIKRLNEELAAAKRQLAAGPPQQQYHSGGFAAPGPVSGEPQSGTPARLHAQADALLSAASPNMEVSSGELVFGDASGPSSAMAAQRCERVSLPMLAAGHGAAAGAGRRSAA